MALILHNNSFYNTTPQTLRSEVLKPNSKINVIINCWRLYNIMKKSSTLISRQKSQSPLSTFFEDMMTETERSLAGPNYIKILPQRAMISTL